MYDNRPAGDLALGYGMLIRIDQRGESPACRAGVAHIPHGHLTGQLDIQGACPAGSVPRGRGGVDLFRRPVLLRDGVRAVGRAPRPGVRHYAFGRDVNHPGLDRDEPASRVVQDFTGYGMLRARHRENELPYLLSTVRDGYSQEVDGYDADASRNVAYEVAGEAGEARGYGMLRRSYPKRYLARPIRVDVPFLRVAVVV